MLFSRWEWDYTCVAFSDQLFVVCFLQLYPDLTIALKEVIDSHVTLISNAVTSERFEEERVFIMKNVDYMFKNLLPLIEKKFKVDACDNYPINN